MSILQTGRHEEYRDTAKSRRDTMFGLEEIIAMNACATGSNATREDILIVREFLANLRAPGVVSFERLDLIREAFERVVS